MPASFAHNRSPVQGYPKFPEYLPLDELQDGKYVLRFAQTGAELEAIKRLRFEVFNLELKEGLETSYASGKDEDAFDDICHHMMIIHRSAGVVGTYRFQTAEMAASGGLGFYSASEFDLTALPAEIIAQGVELGRACISSDHRSLRVLYLLWKGIGMYLMHNNRRYLFGCTSLTSQNPKEGHGVFQLLQKDGHVHPSILVNPQPDFKCIIEQGPETNQVFPDTKARVPRLMRAYLSLGAKVCSPPALDRMFKTIDYFTLFDTSTLTEQSKSYFMPSH